MVQSGRDSFRSAKRAAVTTIAVVLGVLIFGGYAVSSPKPGGARPAPPNKHQDSTKVYEHTYDEVFQACGEAIERMGLFVTAKDKDKGTISGGGKYTVQGATTGTGQITFDLHIEAISTKPETRLTAHAQAKGILSKGYDWAFVDNFRVEVHKVLSTYH